MVQLTILNGKKAGTEWLARRFPVRIGRSAACELSLEEEGVWDQHLVLGLDSTERFSVLAQPNAFATLNGEPLQQSRLHNGDVIGLGALQLRFGLSPTRLRRLRLRETLTWLALSALCLGQIAIVYWLVQ